MMRVTFEVEVEPMSREEIEEDGGEFFEGDNQLPDAAVIADCMASVFTDEDAVAEMFAGSDLFVKIGQASFAAAEYVEEN